MARREPRDGWGRTPGKLVAPYRCCKTLPFHNLDVSVDASLEGPFNDAQAVTEGTKRSTISDQRAATRLGEDAPCSTSLPVSG